MKTKKTVSMKVAVLMMAAVLLIGCTVGGTLAWLMARTDAVTNTFSASNIKISLTETTGAAYKLIPGETYAKDPVVTVHKETDVNCYLFVKVEENNPGNFLTYILNFNDWDRVNVNDAVVYVKEVTASTEDQSWYLLKGKDGYTNGYVTVNQELKLEDMNTASASTLTFTAYAIQQAGFPTAELAWEEAKKAAAPSDNQ